MKNTLYLPYNAVPWTLFDEFLLNNERYVTSSSLRYTLLIIFSWSGVLPQLYITRFHFNNGTLLAGFIAVFYLSR